MKPITPKEALKGKECKIPDAVFEVFNELISKELDGRRACITQNEVVKALEKRGFKRDEIFGNSWLDVEASYQKAGWKVEYDKPGYNEDYEATFTFIAKRPSCNATA